MRRAIAVLALVASAMLLPPHGETASGGSVAIRGGRIVTVTHGVVESGTVLVENGRITAVGRDVRIPDGIDTIDAAGQVVLPGLVDAFTTLGTGDLQSFGPDDDEATSPLTPQLRVIDAFNPDNRFIALARRQGITAALSVPGEGNLLSGQSAVVSLSGDAVEQAVLRFPAAMHVSFGEKPKLRYGQKSKLPSTRMGEAALLRQTLVDAQAYRDRLARYQIEPDGLPPEFDGKLEALLPIVRGEIPAIVSVDRRDDILTVLRIAEQFHVKLVLAHATEAYRVADELARLGVPVLLGPASAGGRRVETLEFCDEAAAILSKAGVALAFQTGASGDSAMLLAEARRAVASGLPAPEALKALTIGAARLLGVEALLGSIDVGKRGDLVVFRGDPLAGEARVSVVIIGGRAVIGNGS